MMEPVRPVFWYQGLFLQPHHFQRIDLHGQSLVYPLEKYMQPYFWGMSRMTIDENALKDNVFELSIGEFIFQDGTWVSLSENGKIRPRSFKGFWADMEKPFKVYIGLRKWDHNDNNVTVVSKESDISMAQSRFICDENQEEIKDLYIKGQVAQVKLLSYILKFFWEGEVSDAGNYHLIPIAILEFNGQDVVLSRDFVAPTVIVSSSARLSQIVKGIRELISSRCRVLEEYKNPKGFQSAEFQSVYLSYFLALCTLNRYLPVFQHITETPHVHPWIVYGYIRQFIGELSSFTDRIDAIGKLQNGTHLVPQYNHEDIGYCFQQSHMLIEEILKSFMTGMENIIHLVREDRYFRAKIPVELLDNKNMYYLFIKTSEDKETVVDDVKRVIKTSCEEDMSLLIQRSLPGLSLVYMPELPIGLPKRLNAICFEIKLVNQYWQGITMHSNICLHWSNAPEDAAIEVVILKP